MADTWWYEKLKPLTALWREDVELPSIFIIVALTLGRHFVSDCEVRTEP